MSNKAASIPVCPSTVVNKKRGVEKAVGGCLFGWAIDEKLLG